MNSASRLYAEAQQVIPGGVCASYRTNRALGHPFFVSRGAGAYVYDLDGHEYVDMCMSHGASLLGHNHPAIKAAVARALDLGIICSYDTEYHTALARKIIELVPGAEMVRFAGSGTETVMHAVRLARAVTGRDVIIKFEGHFHGYSDQVYFSSAPPLTAAGPAAEPTPFAQSSGMPADLGDLVVVVPFNDPAALEAAFARRGHEAAALIMEPINYDAGCIVPQPGFVELCRDLCDRYGVLLFFDEVLTAFRMAPGGAQQVLGVTPDLCVLGKALGGGMPISAIAGRRDVMMAFRPVGDCEHSGTYLAHLTTVLAALAALEEYARPGFYARLEVVGRRFYDGFQEIAERKGIPVHLQHVGPRFGMYFGLTEEVTNYRQAAQQDMDMLARFTGGCTVRGAYFHISAHHGFSAAHSEADMDRVLEAVEGAMSDLGAG
ncbi:MAG: aminotransferase class III-fold pyridoxal phosphate-dependent enzyme [Chloroflexi bacterium]|nr:aminotransferase class III-fold pyridoxal phosphate-dependent enzyme [Chloroflexota bacterium]